MYTFDFDKFTEKDLKRLNNEKNSGKYGNIYLTTERTGYIYEIDVEYETKDDYSRNGIRLEVHSMRDTYTQREWVAVITEITTATNYKRFVSRAKKEIIKVVEEWEKRKNKVLNMIKKGENMNIKSCPFCGEKPKVTGNFRGAYMISCENKDCFIQPFTKANSKEIEELVKIWNFRIDNNINK